MDKEKGYAIVTLYKKNGTAKVEVFNVVSSGGCIQILVRDGNADVVKKIGAPIGLDEHKYTSLQHFFEKELPELEPGWKMIGFTIKMEEEV